MSKALCDLNMENEFTTKRVKTFLTKFLLEIERIIDSIDLSDEQFFEEVKALFNVASEEKKLCEKRKSSTIEDSHYIPALDEVLKFLEIGLDSESRDKSVSILSDAGLSVSYYLAH